MSEAAALRKRWKQLQSALQHRLGVADAQIQDPVGVRVDRIRIVDEIPPVLRYVELGAEGRIEVDLDLTLDPAGDPLPRCSLCGHVCEHGIRALHHGQDFLEQQPASVLNTLSIPPWKQWLKALGEAVQAMDRSVASSRSQKLGWLVYFKARAISPLLCGTSQTKTSLETIESQIAMSTVDRLSFEAAKAYRGERTKAKRDGYQDKAFYRLLERLSGHPRVWLDQPGGLCWQIETVRFGVSIGEDRQDPERIRLQLTAGDRPIEPSDIPHPKVGERLCHLDPETRTLQIASVDETNLSLLRAFAKGCVSVPPSGTQELLKWVSKAATHLVVSPSDEVVEARIEASVEVVLLARVWVSGAKAGLELEVRVEPIPGGPLMKAGIGPEEVLAPSPDRNLLRCTRNFALERSQLEHTVRKLHLPDLDELHTCRIEGLSASSEILQEAETLNLQVRWPDAINGSQPSWHRPTVITSKSLELSADLKQDWLSLRGSAIANQERLELAVLLEAARRDQGYVLLPNQGLARLDDPLVEQLRRLSAMQKPSKGQKSTVVLGKAAVVSAKELLAASGNLSPELEKYVRDLAQPSRTDSIPKGMKAVLRPYQREGAQWLSRMHRLQCGVILADDMGLGKTVQAACALLERAHLGPQLVVAPTSVIANWQHELTRFAPSLRTTLYWGPNRKMKPNPQEVIITTYGTVVQDIQRLAEHRFTSVVLDEAQAIKNPKTVRANAIHRLQFEWGLALSGTPVENNPVELWSLFEAVHPGLLGDLSRFRTEVEASLPSFAPRSASTGGANYPIEAPKDELEPVTSGSGRYLSAIRPFILRRTKDEVAQDLPPKTEINLNVILTERERALYDDIRWAALAEIKKLDITTQTHLHIKVIAAITRLRQLACHPRLVDPTSQVASSKMERFLQLMVELKTQGRRPLVFSQFVSLLRLAEAELTARGFRYISLDGQTPRPERVRRIEQFQTGSGDAFMLSLKAGGTGLNLTAADAVIHLDPWWNPAAEDQATDRTHRLGQTAPVTVFRLVAQDTIEAQILAMNQNKRRLVSEILEGTHQTAKIKASELIEMIARQHAPV